MALSPDQAKAEVEQPVSSGQVSSARRNDSPSSLTAALFQLPQQYLKALVKPSVATYTPVKGQASWGLVWIQLLVWAVLDAALGVLVNVITPPIVGSSFSRFFTIATSYGLVLVVPLLFFLLMGIVYLLARSFGGQGTFLEQCNSSLVIQAPLGILSKLLALIPVVGKILNTVLSLYGIVLQVVVIMAVHRQNRGKAIATLFIEELVVADDDQV